MESDDPLPTRPVVSPRRLRRPRSEKATGAKPPVVPPVIDLTRSSSPGISTRLPTTSLTCSGIALLPEIIPIGTTQLDRADHQLLLRKRAWLNANQVEIPRDMQRKDLGDSIMATLVFGQEEAGTAVCIAARGILLTCSHCVAETSDQLDLTQSHWLVFASGQVVEAKTIAVDFQRDLALLKVVAAQAEPGENNPFQLKFPSISPASVSPPVGSRIVCVGHPGSEDLEADEPGTKTGYDVLHLSTGTFRGHADRQDLHDNSEIGALMHSAWTYWGHSGAPLIDRRTGCLVGLHSSWDDATAMRRGVALEAIVEFLDGNSTAMVD